MNLHQCFTPFLEKRPVCVMARGILERLFDPQRLDHLFDREADQGYTRKLHFSTLADLMSDVVLGIKPSVNAAFEALEQRPDGVSKTALYNKLDRVETSVSAALVRDSNQQCAPAIDALRAKFAPWLRGYRCRILDGNHLAATEHRLKPLRTIHDGPLPGKSLVVLDPERMLVEQIFLTEDGHAQERSLLGDVIPCVQPHDIWIADRNFCTTQFLLAIAKKLAFFVIRQHANLPGELGGKQRRVGRCRTGIVYEQTFFLKDPETGKSKRWRRITIKLKSPTRDGDGEIHRLTNLKKTQAKAIQVAEIDARRWTIETAFQELTTTLQCEIKTLGYPKAALFAFCLAVVAYNAVSLLKASLRAVHGEAKVREEVSGYYLSLEIRGTYDGMMIAIPEEHWQVFGTMHLEEFVALLKELAAKVNLRRYPKNKRGPKKPPPEKKKFHNGSHASTYKLLNDKK